MRRIFQISAVCLAAGFVSSCKPDTIIATTTPPTAGVRFINAVPDSAGAFGLDFRFVDIVENTAQFRMTFRNGPATTGAVIASSQTEYKGAQAGSRHFVIFLDDTLQAIASTVLKDTTVTLTAGKNYTVLLWGAARAGGAPTMKLSVIEENVADPGTQVALRVINTTASPIDVREFATGSALPAAATWASVPAQSISTYVTAAPGLYNYNVQPAGGGTALFADVQALPGALASSSAGSAKLDIAPLPGTLVAGSAVTLVVYPRSTASSRAPQSAAFLVPGGAGMWDRRPPGVPGT